jgi:hypothetical protein
MRQIDKLTSSLEHLHQPLHIARNPCVNARRIRCSTGLAMTDHASTHQSVVYPRIFNEIQMSEQQIFDRSIIGRFSALTAV